jgi:hypothetical protein
LRAALGDWIASSERAQDLSLSGERLDTQKLRKLVGLVR